MGSLYSISKVDGFIIIGPADTSVAPASPSKVTKDIIQDNKPVHYTC